MVNYHIQKYLSLKINQTNDKKWVTLSNFSNTVEVLIEMTVSYGKKFVNEFISSNSKFY